MGLSCARKVFNSSGFHYEYEVNLYLNSLTEYIDISEKVLVESVDKKIQEYDDFLITSNEFEIEYFYDYADHHVKTQIRQIFYNSILISLYSFLERKMLQLCKIAEEFELIKINDISGNGILKYYIYIKKVLKINLDFLNKEWNDILNYNKLRNQIVHSPTNQIKKNNENAKLISNLHSIKNLNIVCKTDYVYFEIRNKNLLIFFLDTIGTFLHGIYYEKNFS
jgi:hypothetical protein